MSIITTRLPTAAALLELEPEELAPILLQHAATEEQNLHLSALLGSHGLVVRHYSNDQRVERALMEAWAWLVREGLLVPRDANGWHFISRRGQRLVAQSEDFTSFAQVGVEETTRRRN